MTFQVQILYVFLARVYDVLIIKQVLFPASVNFINSNRRRMYLYCVLTLLALFGIHLSECLQCFNCQNIHDPKSCKGTLQCFNNQSCFLQTLHSGNEVLYNMGCKNNHLCSSFRADPIEIIGRSVQTRQQNRCHECCSTEYCNEQLCAHREGANITGYRLTPNGLPSDGLLEVNIPGSCDWGPVRYISRYNWRDPLDDLICQHFGYINESVVQPAANQGSYPDACMTITRCPTEAMKTIHDIPDKCDIQYGPPRSDYDNLYKEIKCIPAQLVDGATTLQGRVEAGLFGQLQSICSLGFDARAANVTCASLGYRRGVTQLWQNSHFGAGLKPIYKRNITCSGDELSLELCNHSNTDIPGCDGSNVVGIECKGDMIKLDPLFESRPYEGILEGYHDDFRYDVIGSVSNTTAKTLCSMLGHGFVGFTGLAIPSRNLHYYKMDVSCAGREKSINECKGDLQYCVTQRYYHCTTMSNMNRHVALFCSDYELQGLSRDPDGILLMTVNLKKWAVCADNFTQQTANAACIIFGYTGHTSFSTHTNDANDTEVLGSLICRENAARLVDCHLKHQFSYRPYRVDAACTNHVKLACTSLYK